jgi:hypothetical protein
MILPGPIPLVFYERQTSTRQLAAGFIATVVRARPLGHVSPGGPLGVLGPVIVAIVGAVAPYVAIVAWFYYQYNPRQANLPTTDLPPTSPRAGAATPCRTGAVDG